MTHLSCATDGTIIIFSNNSYIYETIRQKTASEFYVPRLLQTFQVQVNSLTFYITLVSHAMVEGQLQEAWDTWTGLNKLSK